LVPKDEKLSQPTLRHPDLQPSNIFVSPSLEIISVIDWQHSVITPLFLQCGIPNSFQNYGDPLSESLAFPALPPNFDSLDKREKYQEVELLRKRQLYFHYFKETAVQNPLHQAALESEMSILRRKTCHDASDPWE
jgi:aminoglycoside phosphotransferase (APT) family kinase protein